MSEQATWCCATCRGYSHLQTFCGRCGAERPKPEVSEDDKRLALEMLSAIAVAMGEPALTVDDWKGDTATGGIALLAKTHKLFGQEAAKLREERDELKRRLAEKEQGESSGLPAVGETVEDLSGASFMRKVTGHVAFEDSANVPELGFTMTGRNGIFGLKEEGKLWRRVQPVHEMRNKMAAELEGSKLALSDWRKLALKLLPSTEVIVPSLWDDRRLRETFAGFVEAKIRATVAPETNVNINRVEVVANDPDRFAAGVASAMAATTAEKQPPSYKPAASSGPNMGRLGGKLREWDSVYGLEETARCAFLEAGQADAMEYAQEETAVLRSVIDGWKREKASVEELAHNWEEELSLAQDELDRERSRTRKLSRENAALKRGPARPKPKRGRAKRKK